MSSNQPSTAEGFKGCHSLGVEDLAVEETPAVLAFAEELERIRVEQSAVRGPRREVQAP